MHILRANYQALIWNTAHEAFPDIPSPGGYGWKKDDESGKLIFEWTRGAILPSELIDIMCQATDVDTNDETDDHEICTISLDDEVFNDDE